jgi:outer membrane lipase/esterase
MKNLIILIGIALSLFTRFSYADVKSLLIFGDSFSDTGAGFALTEEAGLIPPIPPAPAYFDGRYSDGPNWVDYVSQFLKLPNQDFAVGGAQTGSGNALIGYGPVLGGLFQEIARFKKANKFIKPDVLTVIFIGTNDLLSLVLTHSISSITPAVVELQMQTAIMQLAESLTDLQNLGANKTIIWNLFNLGQTPIFTDSLGFNSLASLFTAGAESYNAELLTLVQQFNEVSDSKYHQLFYFDAFALFEQVRAQLIAEGFSVTEHTLTTSFNYPADAVVTGPPPTNLFFYDQEHLTTQTWLLFAKHFAAYVDTLLDGPRFFAAQQDFVFETARGHRDLVENHFRTINRERYVCPLECCDCCGEPAHFQVYIDGEGKWGTTRNKRGQRGFRYDTQLASIGADYRCNNCLLTGASFTYQRSFARVHNHRGHFNLYDYIPTLYACYLSPNYFVDADLSYHSYHFRRIKRRIPFINGEAKGNTSGWGVEGNLQGGYLYTWGCLVTGPIAKIGYEYAHIQHYREKRAGLLDFSTSTQHQDSLLGKLGWQAFWNRCECLFSPYGEIAYEYEFLRNRKSLRPHLFRIHDNSHDYHRTSNPDRNFMTLNLGVDMQFTKCILANIFYEGETNFHRYNNAVKGEINFNF